MSATVSRWTRTASAVGWAKSVRIVAATISAAPFGITEKTFRTKVDTVALLGGAEHDLADGLDQTAVAVGDDETDTGQAAFP